MLRHFRLDRNGMLEFLQVRYFTLLIILSLAVPLNARHGRVSPKGDVTRTTRLRNEVLMRQRAQRKLAAQETRRVAAAANGAMANQDFGNIAVMQDDGTLFSQPNAFNLGTAGTNPTSVLFTYASGTYTVSDITSTFDMTDATAGT